MPLKFKRTSRFNLNKLSAKVHKDWISTKPAQYRITWRSQACGVDVSPGFQVLYYCYVPGNFDGGKHLMWDFVDARKRLFRAFKKAKEACEKHYQLWEKAPLCPSILALKRHFSGRKPSDIPKWIYGRMNPNILAMLMDMTRKRKTEDDDEELHTIEEIMGLPMPDDYEEDEIFDEDEEEVVVKKQRKPRSDKGKPRKPYKKSDQVSIICEKDINMLPQLQIPDTPKKRGRPKGSKNKPKV